MFTVEDYKLIGKMVEVAIERTDEDLFDRLLNLRGRIGDEVMNDEIEGKRLLDYLKTQLESE